MLDQQCDSESDSKPGWEAGCDAREVRGGALRGGRGEGAGAEVPDLQVGVRPLRQGVQLRMNDCVQHNSGCL